MYLLLLFSSLVVCLFLFPCCFEMVYPIDLALTDSASWPVSPCVFLLLPPSIGISGPCRHASPLTLTLPFVRAGESHSGVGLYVAGTLLTEPCSQLQAWFVSIILSFTTLLVSISSFNLSISVQSAYTNKYLFKLTINPNLCIWWIGKNNRFVSSCHGRDKWHPKVTSVQE